jgi:hypothetical protein
VCLSRRKKREKETQEIGEQQRCHKRENETQEIRIHVSSDSICNTFLGRGLESETCNKNLNGLRFPQFLVLNVNS